MCSYTLHNFSLSQVLSTHFWKHEGYLRVFFFEYSALLAIYHFLFWFFISSVSSLTFNQVLCCTGRKKKRNSGLLLTLFIFEFMLIIVSVFCWTSQASLTICAVQAGFGEVMGPRIPAKDNSGFCQCLFTLIGSWR